MITIIHGDDVVSSRNYLLELKKESKNSIQLNKEDLNYLNILQTLKGKQLFEEQKNIFIENLLSNKKNISESEKILDLIERNSKEFNIYFWEGTEQTKTVLKLFSSAKIKLFKIPQSLFYFLDNIKPNSKENVINFHKTLENSDVDAIFYMILRQFRLLIVLRSEIPLRGTPDLQIDELKRLAPWQKNKLRKQAFFFEVDELKKIYDKLFQIDLKTKIGEITDLTRAIDIFLLDI